jgi:hypothetical protein
LLDASGTYDGEDTDSNSVTGEIKGT